jgi:hypothetical protein
MISYKTLLLAAKHRQIDSEAFAKALYLPTTSHAGTPIHCMPRHDGIVL